MLKTLRFSDKTFPIASFVVCLLAYGVFIPWLGFYWDDWPIILMGKFFSPKAFADFYAYDRPFSAWTYIVSLPFLGLQPFAWQVYGILLRWLTGLFFWLTLRRVWREQRIQTAWMVVLFLVYPVFTLQFISVTFSQHWTCALLYSFSLWAMLKSLNRRASTRWLWWGLALSSSILHLWTMEYFLGMEVFRYVLLWLTVDTNISRRERLGIVFQRVVPYLLIFISNIIWRLFILQLPQEDPNPVRFLQDLSSQPLTGLLTLAQIILRDLLYMLVQVWAKILDPSRVILTSRFFLFSLVFSIFAAGLLALYFSKFADNKPEQESISPSWATLALWVGLLAILLGALPGWMTYRPALDEPYGNRILIPSLFGLSILTVVLIEWISKTQTRNRILLSVLCGVSIYSHLYIANTYREVWNVQRDFYWQLAWRVPALQPGTALLADSEVLLGAGDYSTASAINLMYATGFDIEEFPYWFFNMEQGTNLQMDRLLAGITLRHDFRNWHFEGDADKTLLLDNSLESCMQILAPGQAEITELTPFLSQVLPLVNLSRIITEPKVDSGPPLEIFGPEPAHTWCYYYQKASLARQSGDWEEVVALGEQADQEGYQPVKTAEWLLFVDAYVHVGDFTAAEELTIQIQTREPGLTQSLCAYWSTQTDLPAGFLESISQKVRCG
jgi:hypothetical protein